MVPNPTSRRSFLRATAGVTAGLSLAGCVGDLGGGSEEYPSGEIRNIVPYSTGGGFDAYARLIEPRFEEELDAEVVTENITGGGGVNGGTEVYNADPDGHTMLIWAPGEGLPSQIGQNVAYDLREMSHIGFLTQTPSALIFREDAGIDTWDDMVAAMPDLNWATQGVGGMAHVGMYILAELTGEFSQDDLNFVHYAGTGEVLAGLERGEANAFLITPVDSGAKVVQAIEGTELFLVFSGRDVYEDYLADQGVEASYWATDLDVDGLMQMGTVSSMRRFYTGPPDVPDDVLEVQRSAFQDIVNTQAFIDEADEAGRPILQPDDHEEVDRIIQESYDLLTSEPYRSSIEEAF